MNLRIAELLAALQRAEDELETEIAKSRVLRGFSIEGTAIRFDKKTRLRHRGQRLGLVQFFKEMQPFNLITAPLIYSMIIPIVLFDAWMMAYQHIYLRAYRIPRVRRSDYIVFDRRHLRYLNRIEALNCLYCSYANGVISLAREVAGRTEQYWCPIKHALRIRDPHQRYFQFAEYGDAEGYRSRLAEFRKELQQD